MPARTRPFRIPSYCQFTRRNASSLACVGLPALSAVDLTMQNAEAYNAAWVSAKHSDALVSKRVQAVKAIIDRARRPERL